MILRFMYKYILTFITICSSSLVNGQHHKGFYDGDDLLEYALSFLEDTNIVYNGYSFQAKHQPEEWQLQLTFIPSMDGNESVQITFLDYPKNETSRYSQSYIETLGFTYLGKQWGEMIYCDCIMRIRIKMKHESSTDFSVSITRYIAKNSSSFHEACECTQ